MTRPKRKSIPGSVKRAVMSRQDERCQSCGISLRDGPVEYDHRPAIILRPVNAAGTDYEPPQNDPNFIEALHADCHQERTTGRKPGASKTATTLGSDIWVKTKFARLEKKKTRKKRTTIAPRGFGPSRPFPTGRKFDGR